MVEHQTENLGVRGSNPFVGKILDKENLIKEDLTEEDLTEEDSIEKELTEEELIINKLNFEKFINFYFLFKFYSLNRKLNVLSFFNTKLTNYNFPLLNLKSSELEEFYSFVFKSSKWKTKKKIKKIKRRHKFYFKKTKQKTNKKLLSHVYFLLSVKPDKLQMDNIFWKRFFFLNNWLLSKYVSNIINLYIGAPVTWIFLNILKITTNEEFITLCRRIDRKKILGPFYHSSKLFFYNWFAKLTYFKDPTGFIDLVKTIISKNHLKKHKGLFFSVNRILHVWYSYAVAKKRVKGYSVFFKGKLGKKGSVKKTKFFRKKGTCSLSKKTIRLNYNTDIISTTTGVIGFGVSVYYSVYVYTYNSLYNLLYSNFNTIILIFKRS